MMLTALQIREKVQISTFHMVKNAEVVSCPASALIPELSSKNLGDLGFGQLDQLREIFLLADGKIGQNLAVQSNACLAQAKHQLGIGKTVFTSTGIDTQDPQLAKFALAELTAGIGIDKRTLNSFASRTIQTTMATAEALGHIQIFLVPTMGSKTSLHAHGKYLQCIGPARRRSCQPSADFRKIVLYN